MSDSEYSNDNNGESDNDQPEEEHTPLESPFEQSSKLAQVEVEVTTEGITDAQKKTLPHNSVKKLFQCGYCTKWYDESMSTPEAIDDGNLLCQHCYFWTGYGENGRKEVDQRYSAFGITVVNYVLNCHKDHVSEKCSMAGACYLCEYKIGAVIENIANVEILYPPESAATVTKKNTRIDSEDEFEMEDDLCQKLYASTKIPTDVTIRI